MPVKLFKHKGRIICHVRRNEISGTFSACTGKPSDLSCLSWTYNTFEEANKTASEFFINYTSALK